MQGRPPEENVWNSLATETSILVISALQPRDDGFYVCEAQNGMGQSMSSPLSVEVNGKLFEAVPYPLIMYLVENTPFQM